MGNNNHHKSWGPIGEVKADDIPGPVKAGTWLTLFQEINLRLEQTTRSKALVIPFEDDIEARRAYDSLKRHIKAYGLDVEIVSRKALNGGRNIYVRRGERWQK